MVVIIIVAELPFAAACIYVLNWKFINKSFDKIMVRRCDAEALVHAFDVNGWCWRVIRAYWLCQKNIVVAIQCMEVDTTCVRIV